MTTDNIIRVWTDGACSGNPGPGGWGFVKCLGTEVRGRIGGEPDTTNNRMELTAVAEALCSVLERSAHRPVVIHSDSGYVVDALTKGYLQKWLSNGWVTAGGEPVKNRDLWDRITPFALFRDVPVTFVKVKGHSGAADANAFVDGLATRACSAVTRRGSFAGAVKAERLVGFNAR